MTGDYATTIIPPGIKAHKDFDLYGSLANPEGNPDKALAIIDAQKKAGTPCPSTVKFAFPDSTRNRQLAQTVVEAFAIAGIQACRSPFRARVLQTPASATRPTTTP